MRALWGHVMRRDWTIRNGVVTILFVLLFAAFVTALLLIALFPARVFAHEQEVRVCFNDGQDVKRVKSYAHPSGLWGEVYARYGKGYVLALSPITGYRYKWNDKGEDDLYVEHSEHPVVYIVDTDANGRFDESFTDKGGEGKCEDIQHYEYLGPRKGEDDKDNPKKEAGEIWSSDSLG